MTNYKHCETEDAHLSLHDCRADKVTLDNGILSFFFKDGFWVTPDHPSNDCENVVRTDSSKVDFYFPENCENETVIFVFRRIFGKTARTQWKLNDLLNAVSDGKCEIEFLYQYKSFNKQMIECMLWTKKRPYFKECQVFIPTEKTVYCWNNLCRDRIW